MRPVSIKVTNIPTGSAHIPSYPDKETGVKYNVPLYRVTVSGKGEDNILISENFEAVRFGVKKTTNTNSKIVGLASQQTHILSWSNISTMPGMAWRVYSGFFIHRGPSHPITGGFGSIGCVEITGVGKWSQFNALILKITGCKSEQDVGTNRLATVNYSAATRPPLLKV